jgi:hypothetical protein
VSYDLYLTPEPFDADTIKAWFASRRHYNVSDAEAWYANEDTGVYFGFAIASEAPVAFNLNYFRPHIFGLEADAELNAFTQHFKCRLEDPQGGMDTYSSNGFLDGWNAGNRSAFEIMGSKGEAPLGAEASLIEAAWEWNYARAELQRAAGDKVFVPKVCWVQPEAGEAPLACVTWTWGIPTVIPEDLVTRLVLVRDTKPKLTDMFARNKQRQAEFKLLNVEDGIRLRGVEKTRLGGRDLLLAPPTGSLEVQTLFMGNWGPAQFGIVPADKVCGFDLVALAGG